MVYSAFIVQKARELGIVIDPSGQSGQEKVLICRHVLEGMYSYIRRSDHRVVIRSINSLENDIREVLNEFKDMRDTGEASMYVRLKFIKSIARIIKNIEEAYSHIFAASNAYDLSTDDGYFSASQRLHRCEEALSKVLKEVLINI